MSAAVRVAAPAWSSIAATRSRSASFSRVSVSTRAASCAAADGSAASAPPSPAPPDGGPASLTYGYPNPDFSQSEDQTYGRTRFYLGWRDDAANAFPSPGGGTSGEYALAFQKVFLEGDERWKSLLTQNPGNGALTTNIQ